MARPALRFAALIAALAFLLPLAADSCETCLWEGASPACCPPSCCSCCVHSPSVLTASAWASLRPTAVDLAASPRLDPSPSSPPRDIFHVPKPALL